MKVKFWGVRGSIPAPGPQTAEFGGNTSCVEMRTDAGEIFIFDAGTGIRECGLSLLKQMPLAVKILVSHTHWDHIHGFPFFVPAFIRGNTIDFYGPSHFDAEKTLKKVIELQMDYAYFPVREAELNSRIEYHDLQAGTYTIGGARVTTGVLNHPVHTLGYRCEADGKVVVYTGDNETYRDNLTDASEDDAEYIAEVRAAVEEGNRNRVRLCQGADLLICDSQYTPEEYPSKVGWGHSPWDDVVRLGAEAGVRRLALTHHEPVRNDEGMRKLEADARRLGAELAPGMEVFAAREKVEICL
ncbi:MAG: MBL fold metallo-hydrolase [Planctomycetes bacterium]|nr:MBL fold metallo-hydrolase [Planctomycetota bacterium]